MKTMNTIPQEDMILEELTAADMEPIAGGSPFESSFADSALYRAGVSFENVCFGSDRFYIGSQQISKDLARTLRDESTKLWNAKYAQTANLVDYMREWKETLASKYNISWNGKLGSYAAKPW